MQFQEQVVFPKGGKGKGPPPSLEDRKRRLAEIKAKTSCKVCGKKGHWAGDSVCEGKPETANVALIGERELELRETMTEPSFLPPASS